MDDVFMFINSVLRRTEDGGVQENVLSDEAKTLHFLALHEGRRERCCILQVYSEISNSDI